MTLKDVKSLLHDCFILTVLEYKLKDGKSEFDWDESERKVIDFVLSEYKKEKKLKTKGV